MEKCDLTLFVFVNNVYKVVLAGVFEGWEHREQHRSSPRPANTEQDVQDMFDTGYYRYPDKPFGDGKYLWGVVHGTHCLWKNVPTGKNGGESTKVELFHGECHEWVKDDFIIS